MVTARDAANNWSPATLAPYISRAPTRRRCFRGTRR
jgi:hypothetical protein